MQWLLVGVLVTSGCAVCEPYIEYDQDPVPMGEDTCASLMFVERPIDVQWYPLGTRAAVRECHDIDLPVIRRFECRHEGYWFEFIMPFYY